jgi:hypothetical protein
MTEESHFKVHDPMLDRPEFAAALGTIVSQASYLETQLAELFSEFVGTDPQRGEILYWAFPSFNQRQRTMVVLMEASRPAYEVRATDIIRRAKDFIEYRNASAHNLWAMTGEGSPLTRIAVNKFRNTASQSVKVKLKEIREQVDCAVQINSDLAKLIWDIQTGQA